MHAPHLRGAPEKPVTSTNVNLLHINTMRNSSAGAHFKPFLPETAHPSMSSTFYMPNFRYRTAAAFTLIEMVIVIAIIAILALMAVPSLMGQFARSQIKESMPLMDFAITAVTGKYKNGEFPADNDAAGLPKADKIVGAYVTSVEVKEGAITMTFGNNANGKLKSKKLTKRPALSRGEKSVPMSWFCGNKNIPSTMEPSGKNETDVPGDVLPVECR